MSNCFGYIGTARGLAEEVKLQHNADLQRLLPDPQADQALLT
jgi:hypothetical protein